MKFQQSILSSDKGFSLLELLVAVGLSLIVGAIALSHFESTQRMVRYDMKRTALNQNLRSALDIIGINVRLAGENLPGFFPAVLIFDGGDADTFTIRRSIIDENLTGCQDIASGSSSSIVFADSTHADAQCSYSNKIDILNAWSASRTTQGGTGLAYIYDRVANHGEWFSWAAETDTGTAMWIAPSAMSWVNDYSELQTFAYVLEQWEFSLVGDTLQMVIDNDTANPINVVNGLSGFDVSLELEDGSEVQEYTAGDNWSQIALVNVDLTAQDTSGNQEVTRTMSGSFFPRNVLSN